MRIHPQAPPISETEERQIRDQIEALRSKLPPRENEPREPLHALVVRTYLDGASHSRPGDLNSEWAKVGHGIRETIRQGGEVVVRPLYPGEQVAEQKYYPGRERLMKLEAFLDTAAGFHASGWDNGDIALRELADEALELVATRPGQKAGGAG